MEESAGGMRGRRKEEGVNVFRGSGGKRRIKMEGVWWWRGGGEERRGGGRGGVGESTRYREASSTVFHRPVT